MKIITKNYLVQIRALLLFSMLLLTDACVERFDIPASDVPNRLVVDGMITDQPGPYTVRVFFSAPLEDQLEKVNYVTGATVTLFDDQGGEEVLAEETPGHYQTSTTQGTIGNTYYIRVVMPDEAVYESEPEKLLPVGEIKDIYFEFEQNEDPLLNNQVNTSNGFNVFIDSEVLPEQNGRVRWRWSGTFAIQTYPERQTKHVPSRDPATSTVPDPPACSGYVYSPRTGLRRVDECTCCFCWVDQQSTMPSLSDEQFVNNGSIRKTKIVFLEANRRLFYEKYYVQVEQLSVSEASFDFWDKVRKQQSSGSDLFQTPPAETTGNIKRVSDSGIPVIGIFSASSIRKKTIFISRADIPYFLTPIDTLAMTCLKPYKKSTTTKPIFW